MLKKILAGALVLIVVSTTGASVYAIPDGAQLNNSEILSVKQTDNPMKVISPEDNLISSEKIVLLSGKTKEGSEIIVDVYSVKDIPDTNLTMNLIHNEIVLNEIEEELVDSYTFEIGDLGIFAEEIELIEGKNKIVIKLMKDDEIKMEIVKFVNVMSINEVKSKLEQMGSMNFTETIQQIINTVKETITEE